MALWPNSPLELPSPPGQTSVAEFIRIHVELNDDAHRKTTFAVNSVVCFVSESMTSTPVARAVSLSNNTRRTMEKGRSVRFPVFVAAGNVDDCVLKYAPYGQPR